MPGESHALIAPPQKSSQQQELFWERSTRPHSTPKINEMVMAAKFNNRLTMTLDDVCSCDWQIRGEKRVFLGPPSMAIISRRLLNKAFREYRAGRVEQLLVVLSHNETMTKCPWIWDYPVCIPFKGFGPPTRMTRSKCSGPSPLRIGHWCFTYHLLAIPWIKRLACRGSTPCSANRQGDHE